MENYNGNGTIRIMFQDEASFGRISDPAHCWSPPKHRPCVPFQRVRQYKPVYGAVSPIDGESVFVVLEKCNTENMNVFLKELSEKFPDDMILLCMDRASFHKSKELETPKNIVPFHIPPRTPEMNPIEQIWKEIRKRGFKNQIFDSLEGVVNRFHETVAGLSKDTVISITLRTWIHSCFLDAD